MTRKPVLPTNVLLRPAGGSPRHRTGFTIIELLTVIGIIVILMAILLPVASKVRMQVRVASTQQEMNKIAGAIDQYYLEFNHTYPGPLPNSAFNPTAASPVARMTMTENLVLGLCGGLEFAGGTVAYNPNSLQAGLGPMNLNVNLAKQTRHVAFIDPTPGQRMPDLPWVAGPGDSVIPEFMDKFNTYGGGVPRPILYLRARVGNPVISGGVITAPDNTSTQYNYVHLIPYADTSPANPTADFSFGTPNANVTYYANWQTYLGNPNTAIPPTSPTAPPTPTAPRGVNAFMLISAGPDGVYGTQDDLFYP